MSDKLNNSQTGSFDTIQLNEAESDTSTVFGRLSNLKKLAKSSFNKFRRNFASHCDNSLIAGVMDKLYFSIIKSHLKIIGTFFLSFSLISIFVGYISNRNPFSYLTNVNSFGSFVILAISLFFLSSKKNVNDVLSYSKFVSDIGIVYTQFNVLEPDISTKKSGENYLTAFFAGVICGIISIFYPSATLALFVVTIVLVILILNRPECGLLMSFFTTPFFSETASVCLIFITFLSLIYRFLRRKRHIDLGITELLIILSSIYVMLRGIYPVSGVSSLTSSTEYICLFVVAIVTISLIRTTSMLRRTINVIMSVSRIYALMLALYYVLCILFDSQTVNIYLSNVSLSGIFSAVTSADFVVPFLSMAIPMHFMHLFEKKSSGKMINLIFMIVLLLCTLMFRSYLFTLTVIVSCIAVIAIQKPKLSLLLIPAPALAFGIIELSKLTPERFCVYSRVEEIKNAGSYLQLFSDNGLFGIGINDILPLNVNSSLMHLLLCIGVLGVIAIFATLFFLFFKAFKFVFAKNKNATRAKAYTAGLLCSSLSYIVTTIYTNSLSDFRVSMIFVIIISLAYVSGRCFEADYIAPDMIREHN